MCEALALSRQLVGAGCVAGLGLCGSGLCGAGVWAASVSAECREPYRADLYGPSKAGPSWPQSERELCVGSDVWPGVCGPSECVGCVWLCVGSVCAAGVSGPECVAQLAVRLCDRAQQRAPEP